MMKSWKKTVSVLSAGMLLSGVLFTSTVDASQAKKKIEAQYNNIKIINNDQSVTIDPKTEPFIYNGVTYIPLRMLGELYNKTVQWSVATNTIIIKDKTPQISQATINSLNAQINAKDAQIAQLKAEIAKLQAAQNKTVNLDDLESQLNDDYSDNDDIDDVEIILSGNKDAIDVRVDVNAADWDDLTVSEQEDFLQDIIDDILYDYKDADVEGTVKDADEGDLLASFDTDSDGDINLEDEGISLDDLEEQLYDDYYDYYDDDLEDVDISLSSDKDEIDLTIEANGDDWDALSDNEQLNFLQDIVDDILDEFEDAEINGTVEDADNGDELDTFYADGGDDGEVEID